MNKKLFMSVLALFCLLGTSVYAQPKIDIVSGIERGLGSVGAKVGEVMKKVNAAAKKVEESQFGQAIKTNIETAKALVADVKANLDAGKELYEKAQEVIEEGTEAYNQAKEFADQAINEGKGAYELAMEEAQKAQSLSVSLLQKDIAETQKKMEERKKVVSDEISAKLDISRENMDALEQILELSEDPEAKETARVLLAEAQLLEQQYEAQREAFDQDENTVLEEDKEFSDLKNLYEEKMAQLTEAKELLSSKGLDSAFSFVKGMIKKSPQEKKADYEAAISANFIGPDEKETPETVERVRKERRKNLKEDMVSTFTTVMQMRSNDAKRREDIERISDNVATVDYEITAQRLANEQSIQQMQLLHDNLTLEIMRFRMKTAADINKMKNVRLNNQTKNPSEINMDNYELTEDQVKDYLAKEGESK